MLIRLDAARYEPFFWQESIELKEEEIRELELLGTSAVRCAGSQTHAEPDYLLHADLSYELTVACNRCLNPVQQAVESTLDLVLVERSRKREATEEEQLEAQELGLVEVDVDQKGRVEGQPCLGQSIAVAQRAQATGDHVGARRGRGGLRSQPCHLLRGDRPRGGVEDHQQRRDL